DELDTLNKDHAEHAWKKVIARNSQLPRTYRPITPKPANKVSVFTTPEGFRFVHDRWAVKKKQGYEMIQATTTSNHFLPEDYVQS
ncbi:terminase, partial [Salmonella enterica subsp. enterica serovar Enteritidis]